MCNQDVRTEIKQAGLKYWQIAHAIGINDGNFSRKLRVELPPDEKQRIKEIIKQIKEAK